MSNSKFKAEFTLKQHTPIIHFQSNQSGATLRATELKPKFDRFLIEKVFKKDKSQYEKYLIDKEKDALNYKVKIKAIGNKISTIETLDYRGKEQSDPLFFGNMGDGEKKKFALAKGLKIEFISFIPEVTKIIKENFEAFLAQNNFGTRQSKGFGSFYLDKSFDKSLIPYKVYSFSSDKWKSDIKLLYSFLRQGINLPRGKEVFYAKPAIFTYAVSKNITWDKKAIKQHFFANELRADGQKYESNSPVNFTGQNSYLLRDLFGLSSEQSWMSYRATIKKENNEISRFKSPLTFKIVNNQVFFWADNSVQKILNKTFKIISKGNKPLELTTPKEFNFDDFFEYTKTIDLSKHINQQFHNTNTFKDLTRILNGIKESK